MLNHLPYSAINYVTSRLPNGDLRVSAKNLVNLQLKKTRTVCTVQFLKVCIAHGVIPTFATNWIRSIPEEVTKYKAIKRKMQSLMLETVRVSVKEKKRELESVEQKIGHEYLKVVRMCTRSFVIDLLQRIDAMVNQEERILHARHCRKWTDLTNDRYPLGVASYFCERRPCFPFAYSDDFWCVEVERSGTSVHMVNNFTNDTEHDIPAPISQLFSKGPKFRVPPKLNANFTDKARLDLETLTYKLRWNHVFQKQDCNRNDLMKVPFQKTLSVCRRN